MDTELKVKLPILVEIKLEVIIENRLIQQLGIFHRVGVVTNVMFLDIIHRPVFILKHNVSEIGFCLRLQVKPSQLGSIDRASPEIGMNFIYWALQGRLYLKTEGESVYEILCF
jgi:hypothetical protein